MKFIPIDKMAKLREAAKNGDERARKILHSQMDGGDFDNDLNDYFNPQPAPEEIETEVAGVDNKDNERLNKFLADNNISKDSPEYEEAIKEFNAEIGKPESEEPEEEDAFGEIIKKLMKEESDAIDDYSKAITEVMNLSDLDEVKKRRAIARFKEIRQDEEEHFKELSALLKDEEIAE